MAVKATFSAGKLTVLGDDLDNTITEARDAAGNILINGGAVADHRRHADSRQHQPDRRCSARAATTSSP